MDPRQAFEHPACGENRYTDFSVRSKEYPTPSQLSEGWCTIKGRQKVVGFYGHSKGEYQSFSNFYYQPSPTEFEVPDCCWPKSFEGRHEKRVTVSCSEKSIMLCKAALFEDHDIYEQILSTENPRQIKGLGRGVRGFDVTTWSNLVTKVAFEAVYQKFSAKHLNREREVLLRTGTKLIAEAAPADRIWGIGMGTGAAEVLSPAQWQGHNILGWALMAARDCLKAGLQSTTLPRWHPAESNNTENQEQDSPSAGSSRQQQNKELIQVLKARLGPHQYRVLRAHSHEFQQTAAAATDAATLRQVAETFRDRFLALLHSPPPPSSPSPATPPTLSVREMMQRLADLLPDESQRAALASVMQSPPRTDEALSSSPDGVEAVRTTPGVAAEDRCGTSGSGAASVKRVRDGEPVVGGSQQGQAGCAERGREEATPAPLIAPQPCSPPSYMEGFHQPNDHQGNDSATKNRGKRQALGEETLQIIRDGGYHVGWPASDGGHAWVPVPTEHVSRSVFYKEGHRWTEPASSEARGGHTRVEITGETTMEAIFRFQGGKRIAALNFASAHNPGGGFLRGSVAQEEVLARSSTLYPSLTRHLSTFYRQTVRDGLPADGGLSADASRRAADKPAFADPTRKQGRRDKGALYTDDIIYSPDVVFFRNNAGTLLPQTYRADIVTCACVNQHKLRGRDGRAEVAESEVRRVMVQRMRCILRAAQAHRVQTLVLGAWGTGVFGNRAEDVAWCFKEALSAALQASGDGFVENVVFAIPDPEKVEQFARVFGNNHSALECP